MRRDLTAGGRGAEQPMSHLEGRQRRGKAGGEPELPQPPNPEHPRTQTPAGSVPAALCRGPAVRRRLAVSVLAEQRAVSCPLHPGVLHLRLDFSSV